ncbi:MAG: hypothetical protein ACXWV4_11895, partial [Flavitalea sp.]
PLNKLRKNLLTGIIVAVLTNLAYIAIFFFISLWIVYISLSVLIIFNIYIIITSWKLYQKTSSLMKSSNSLKDELELHYNSFQRWWSIQQKISLFIYPIATTGGFVMGGFLGSGKPVETFLYNGVMLGILAITILILMPICYYGARWMFKFTYGKYLEQLKTTIDELG